MKSLTKFFAVGAMAVSAVALSATANAAAVDCDLNYPEYTRYMTLTNTGTGTDPTCFESGLINEKYSDLIYKLEDPSGTEGPGPNPFDSFKGLGGESGSFEFNTTFGPDAIIVFKFGGAGATNVPDWIAYKINGMTEADWSWNGKTALSHVAVYGTTTVPEPTTLALMGLGLLGVGMRLRRREVA